MIKTVMEMMAVLGKNVEDIQKIDDATPSQREITLSRAQATAMTAKQFMVGAGLVQKGDVMSGRHEATDFVIGYYKSDEPVVVKADDIKIVK